MVDARHAADQLVAYWDALVLDRPRGGFAVEDDLASALARLHQLREVAPGDARQRVWQDLQPALEKGYEIEHPRLLTVLYARPPEASGKPVAAAMTPQPRRPYFLPVHLATAALVLLTLTLGLATLGSGRINRNGPGVPAPTIGAPAHPAASETVFAFKAPAQQLPTAANLHSFVWRLSLDPGRSTLMSPRERPCCEGPRITFVLSGELTVRAEGSQQVFHHGELSSAAGVAPAGTAVVLRSGDAVIHDDTVPVAYVNDGSQPVQLIVAGLSTRKSSDPWAATMDYLDGSENYLPDPLPAGPVMLSLVRATLEPGGEFPAPPPGSGVLEVGEHGDASIGMRMDGSLFNINTTAETIYIFIVEPLGNPTITP